MHFYSSDGNEFWRVESCQWGADEVSNDFLRGIADKPFHTYAEAEEYAIAELRRGQQVRIKHYIPEH